MAGGRKKQANSAFENLQEMAKQQQEQAGEGLRQDMLKSMNNGDMAELQKMIQDSLSDPETQKYLEQMGGQLTEAMEALSKLSPEEIQQQMKEAFELLGNEDMITGLVDQRDSVIQNLEGTGIIPPEELARMKTDPQYFELKMRESFDQMKDVFNDPEMMDGMAAAMGNMRELMGSGGEGLLGGMAQFFGADEETIEQARLEILRGDYAENPMFQEMFDAPEIKELLSDPVKWREAVKDGQKDIKAAVGEEL